MFSAFVAHGKTEIKIKDNIIIIRSIGPWNVEYFRDLHQEVIAATSQVNINNYAILLVPIGEALGVAEAIDYHVDFIKQGNAKAVAINLANSDIPNTTKNLCSKAYELSGLNYQFFSSDESATEWLQQLLD
jgi:hypothetical protein